jgi:UDP-3-O-[3-hydroxymyristoyl] glucosamine N-acyltransferase
MEQKTLNEIMALHPVIHFTGSADHVVKKAVELTQIQQTENAIAWCNQKNIPSLAGITKGTIITPKLPSDFTKAKGVNYLEVNQPRHYFLSVLKLLYPDQSVSGVSGSAKIFKDVQLGKGISIGENVVIESGASVGDNVKIGHNTVIHANTIIGNNVIIGSNCTIGGQGFGYQKNEQGEYEPLPHIGNVVIEENVEIGNNVCIDRAVLSSTILKRNVKVDNLVHVAHNVVVDENSLLIANSMIGGSTIIGKNVWVAPSASIINKTEIGDDAVIGMGAVIIKKVEPRTIVAGNPGKFLKKIDD